MDFRKSRFIPGARADLAALAAKLEEHFAAKGYETDAVTGLSSCEVSVSKGGLFKAVLGLKTALKIELRDIRGGLRVRAGVGIFGQQAVPTAIMLFLFWPVIATQVWGLVQQARLDDEAVDLIERELAAARDAGDGDRAPATPVSACVACEEALRPDARFCAACGTKVATG